MTDEEVSCLGKVTFPSRRAGRRRAKQIRGSGGPDMRAYRCTGPHGPTHLTELPQ